MTDAERIKNLIEDIKDLEQRLYEAQLTIKTLRAALSGEVKQLIKESFTEGNK